MKLVGKILIASGVLLLGSLIVLAWPDIRNIIRLAEPQNITAQVQLINKCQIASSNFVVRNTKTGRSAQFSNGVARIDAVEGTYLQLGLVSRFSDVSFNGEQQRAKNMMRMTAGCIQGERMRGVVDGLGGTFGADR